MKDYFIMLRAKDESGSFFREFPLLHSYNEDEILAAFKNIHDLFIPFGWEVGNETIGSKSGTQIYLKVFWDEA